MTKKIFWTAPYQVTVETVITEVRVAQVLLAETVFYAESGGQESDHGTIAGREVLRAQLEGADIAYSLSPAHGLAVGDRVVVAIEWPRRYRLMRLHFAAELILELVCRKLGEVQKIGAHIAEDKARIDFEWPENLSPLFPELLESAHEIIHSDRKIVSAFSDEAAGRRYWEIEGLSRVPCGGTHLRTTGEVGELMLKRKNVGKGKERIEIHLKDHGKLSPK